MRRWVGAVIRSWATRRHTPRQAFARQTRDRETKNENGIGAGPDNNLEPLVG
jgi:hypothetical protein